MRFPRPAGFPADLVPALLSTLRVPVLLSALLVPAHPAFAARHAYDTIADSEDGHLINGNTWDDRPLETTVDDLLITLGRRGGDTYEATMSFDLSNLDEDQVVEEVRLRLSQQGGAIPSGLTIEIAIAKHRDPLSKVGKDRFALKHTNARVQWTIPAAWDSSGQRIAKWVETPDLSPLLNELLSQGWWNEESKVGTIFLEYDSGADGNWVQFDDVHDAFSPGGNAGIAPARLIVNESFYDAFWGKELLARPKPTGITVNIVPHADADAYVEWGTDGVSFPSSTSITAIPGTESQDFEITGLAPDTQYSYRLRYRKSGDPAFETGATRTFVTLPLPGTQARIAVTSDMHVTNSEALALNEHLDLLDTTLLAMESHLAPQRYHLWMDLGDLVIVRAQRIAFDAEEVEQRYRAARERVDLVGHSLPFVLVRGNHEEVNGWDYDGSPDNTAIWSGQALLKWFPPPLPDGFYSGNASPFPDLGLPGNYFAFDVGDARIRAIDPFLFSTVRPHNGHGEVGGSLDGWDWELGQAQYEWLRDDFQSPRPFQFLATHHLTSCYTGSGLYYGRGGIEVSKYAVDSRPTYEWGGEDDAGTNVIATRRPGYSHGAVHDMIATLGNQVVLKGHDHFYGKQELDGMVYLTMPRPDDTGQQTGNLWGWRFFTFYPDAETTFLENSGWISLTVDDQAALFEYVQSYPVVGAGTVRDSFTILPGGGAVDAGLPAVEPRRTWIHTVSPNPARIPPRLGFELGEATTIRLSIHDARGRLVRVLESGPREAGLHETLWDARDRNDRRVAAGVYFANLATGRGRVDSVKMIVIR